MINTGIIRELDELGRIVIPIEIREQLGLKEKTPVEIFVKGKNIILQKYEPSTDRRDSLGIVRRLDELGRIVIPVEIREKFELFEKCPVEIFTQGKKVILKRHEITCLFCNSSIKLKEFKDKLICDECIDQMKAL